MKDRAGMDETFARVNRLGFSDGTQIFSGVFLGYD